MLRRFASWPAQNLVYPGTKMPLNPQLWIAGFSLAVVLWSGTVHAQVPLAPALEPIAPSVAPDPALDALIAGLAGADATDTGLEQKQLDIYGFVDLAYFQPLVPKDSPWLQYFPDKPSFILGNLNLYLDAQIAPRLRSMVETRLMLSPRGAATIAPGGGCDQTKHGDFRPR